MTLKEKVRVVWLGLMWLIRKIFRTALGPGGMLRRYLVVILISIVLVFGFRIFFTMDQISYGFKTVDPYLQWLRSFRWYTYLCISLGLIGVKLIYLGWQKRKEATKPITLNLG